MSLHQNSGKFTFQQDSPSACGMLVF